MRSLRLFSLRSWNWFAVVLLAGLAVLFNQLGLDLIAGARFYLGSSLIVLALLLQGNRGFWVGLVSILLVPRLWQEPSAMLASLAELVWLKLYLDYIAEPTGRRETGWIVLADILFWILIAIPLDILVFGLIADLDLGGVLNGSLRYAVNGAFNAVLGLSLYVLIRWLQARRDPSRSCGIRPLIFVALMTTILVPSLLSLSFGVHQLTLQLGENQLQRFRLAAALSAGFGKASIAELTEVRRQSGSLLEVRLFDDSGRLTYDSNPALSATLEHQFFAPDEAAHPPLRFDDSLELLIPDVNPGDSIPSEDSYWRYRSDRDRAPSDGSPMAPRDRIIVVVGPAKASLRELASQRDHAVDLLGLILLVSAPLAESISRAVEKQFPEVASLQPGGGDAVEISGWSAFRTDVDHTPWQTSPVRELRWLQLALQISEEGLLGLREDLRRSEIQRRRLETEVSRLNILDPLTGCFNRRELYRRLDHEVTLCLRDHRDFSFVCLEIDHLRQIQLSYGASASDEILRRVALEMRSRCRTTDLLCRFSDDQFGLLLPACDVDAAAQLARTLADSISSMEIRHETSLLAVTASLGVTALHSERDDPESLITRAQSALYRAKAEGRNRVVVA